MQLPMQIHPLFVYFDWERMSHVDGIELFKDPFTFNNPLQDMHLSGAILCKTFAQFAWSVKYLRQIFNMSISLRNSMTLLILEFIPIRSTVLPWPHALYSHTSSWEISIGLYLSTENKQRNEPNAFYPFFFSFLFAAVAIKILFFTGEEN